MGKKANNFRAWRYQNPNGTVEDAWNAAWEGHNALQYSRTIQEKDAEIERVREDAERYRFLRDEDNWGCDNDETTESRWGDLGECHGGDFDAFVDEARTALAGKGGK